jgi:toxin FitB
MYVLDTDVVSELRRPERAHRGVLAWATRTPLVLHFIASITLYELVLGIVSLERKDRRQGAILRAWMDRQLLPGFEGRILALDAAVAQRAAALHVPNRRPERNAFIAATALVHRMTVVTRN